MIKAEETHFYILIKVFISGQALLEKTVHLMLVHHQSMISIHLRQLIIWDHLLGGRKAQ